MKKIILISAVLILAGIIMSNIASAETYYYYNDDGRLIVKVETEVPNSPVYYSYHPSGNLHLKTPNYGTEPRNGDEHGNVGYEYYDEDFYGDGTGRLRKVVMAGHYVRPGGGGDYCKYYLFVEYWRGTDQVKIKELHDSYGHLLERYIYDKRGNLTGVGEYNEDGKLIKSTTSRSYNRRGYARSEIVHTYNPETGRVANVSRATKRYNRDGKLIRENIREYNYETHQFAKQRKTYEYYASGNLKSETLKFTDGDGNVKYEYLDETTKKLSKATKSDGSYIVYEYFPSGNLMYKWVYTKDGELLDRYFYIDEDFYGNEVGRLRYRYNYSRPEWNIYIYQNDETDVLKSREHFYGNDADERLKDLYEYNEDGNLVKLSQYKWDIVPGPDPNRTRMSWVLIGIKVYPDGDTQLIVASEPDSQGDESIQGDLTALERRDLVSKQKSQIKQVGITRPKFKRGRRLLDFLKSRSSIYNELKN